jgi:hypothetical protein
MIHLCLWRAYVVKNQGLYSKAKRLKNVGSDRSLAV